MTLGKEAVKLRCIEPHYGTLKNGTEFFVAFGQLIDSDAEPVKRNPSFFEPATETVPMYVPASERPGYEG